MLSFYIHVRPFMAMSETESQYISINCWYVSQLEVICKALVFEVSKQKDFQRRRRLILTTTKLEKPIVDDDQDFSASGSNLARGDNEACLGGSQL